MSDVNLIIYPSADTAAAKRFFGELLGVEPYADSPQYTGYKNGSMEIGITQAKETREPGGALAYWSVDDISGKIKALEAAGGTVVQNVTDVGYGLLVASVKDPNGSIVGLRQFPKK
ncbi:MAG TPA: VOC family protein [Candidatus Baltobacteraceae bacterium]|nr:VOC family protein [Candidatus Baltobacteraceae bacterium]